MGDAGLLADRIHPLSKDQKFQKRKEEHPNTPKQSVSEIGKIKYDEVKHDASKDSEFLRLSKDERFQSRKEQNPLKKKETMEEIGDNEKYDGVKDDDSKDSGFLVDRSHPLSKDEQFQSQKEQNPLKKKETIKQIGDNRKYD